MLSKAAKSKIKDSYDGSHASIEKLSKTLNVANCSIRYFLNHKGYKEQHRKSMERWKVNNPGRFKEINKKAGKKYRTRPEIKLKAHKLYLERKNKVFK